MWEVTADGKVLTSTPIRWRTLRMKQAIGIWNHENYSKMTQNDISIQKGTISPEAAKYYNSDLI